MRFGSAGFGVRVGIFSGEREVRVGMFVGDDESWDL